MGQMGPTKVEVRPLDCHIGHFYPWTDRFGGYSDQHGVSLSVDASLFAP